MNLPALLVSQTIPIAGFLVAVEDCPERRELFLLCYVAVLGLFVTALACLDDQYGLTEVFGFPTGGLEDQI